jgi:UDP-N-acetylmuramyl pentapeptide synthase
MREFIILSLLFWLPVIFVLIRNLSWDLHLWEIKEFRTDRILNYIRWDHEPNNRKALSTYAKYILFAAVSLIFVSPVLALVATLIAYIIYIFEVIHIIEINIRDRNHKRAKFSNIRSLVITILFIFLIVFIVLSITAPFLTIERVANPLVQTITTTSSNLVLYDVYVYLGISTIIALFIDIAMPVVVFLLVVLSSPITRFKNAVIFLAAKEKLNKYRKNIYIIAVTGSHGKTTFKDALGAVIDGKLNVLKTLGSSPILAARSIYNEINEKTEVVIVEIDEREIDNFNKFFSPDILVITDLHYEHVGLFKNRADLLKDKLKLIKNTNPKGVVIVNGESKTSYKLANKFKGKKAVYGFKNLSLATEIVFIKISNIKKGRFFTSFKYNDEMDFKVPTEKTDLVKIITPIITIAKYLKLEDKEILKNIKLIDFEVDGLEWETKAGDNETTIITSNYPATYKGLVSIVSHSYKQNVKKIILFTDGIKELGKYKSKLYLKLVERLKHKIDVLITTDSQLADIARMNEIYTVHVENSLDKVEFELRKESNKKDLIIIESDGLQKELISSLEISE